ncbi:hypothetical protein GCM10009860_06430 [Microbacterium mitrae]|uniref:DUF1648 domain-containing protein n=1 Tax=Microbacterium mitrae TaxID=664640 RepID=A0A5C8HPF5_9MICO|nr:DUF1648 domain-containing protein [Microbacterium mitrae]TXK06020.1 DUF1648 domain-containing protein [Microbacterium mitrae]
MTTTNTSSAALIARARRRFLIVGLWVPGLITLVAVALQLLWLRDLPNPAAIHFGTNGPDGFGPRWTYPLLTGLLGIGMLLLTALPVLAMAHRGRWSVAPRLLAPFVSGTVLMLAIGLTLSVQSQRGLTDATQAPDVGVFLLIGVGIGIGYAIVAWFAQPALVVSAEDAIAVTARTIPAGTRAAWMQTISVRGAGLALMIFGVGLVLVMAIIMTTVGQSTAWVMWLLVAFMLVLVATMFVFRVRIDATGFTARSIVGFPRFHIALDEVADAKALTVSAMADFGGWGLRVMPGNGVGIIMRSGEALQIVRTNGKKLTVTVNDAVRAAELLLGLRDRAAS